MDTFTIPKYNSATGEGTLSSIAKQYGVSMQSILDANKSNTAAIPNISDPNKIIAGQSLVIPKQSPIQTTTAYAGQTAENNAKLDQALVQKGSATQNNTATTNVAGTDQNNTNTASGISGSYGINDTGDLTDQNGNVIDSKTSGVTKRLANDGSVYYTDKSGNTVAFKQNPGTDAAQDRYDDDLKLANNTYKQLLGSINASADALIRQIQASYQERVAQTRESNRRLLSSKEALGYRTGRARYAAKTQAGILTAEEEAGNDRIHRLTMARDADIAKAEAARQDGNMKAFNELMASLDKTQKNLSDEINNQFTRAKEQEQLLLQRRRDELSEEKQQFEMMETQAEALARSLAPQLEGLTESQKIAAVKKAADEAGIDVDMIYGYVDEALRGFEKDDLGMQNTRSLIAQRGLEMEKTRKEMSDETDWDDLSTEATNILEGVSSFKEFRDITLKESEKIKADLRKLGYYTDVPPEWFVSKIAEEFPGGTPSYFVSEEWKKERQRAGVI